MTSTATSSSIAPAPDWATIAETIRCPLCEYDLRGLSEPRCPECGYQFAWPELLEADRRAKLFVFEHAIANHRRAFIRTSLAGWLPWSFWRRLQPQDPIDGDRLRLYGLISQSLFIVGAIMGVLIIMAIAGYVRRHNVPGAIDEMTEIAGQIDRHMVRSSLLCAAMFIAWPWMTCGVLLLFAESMHRANVRPIHVQRCTIYACDPGFIFGFNVTLILFVAWLNDTQWFRFGNAVFNLLFDGAALILLAACAALALLIAIRLAFAYRYYLRFPHPTATAIASQVIVLLVAAIIITAMY